MKYLLHIPGRPDAEFSSLRGARREAALAGYRFTAMAGQWAPGANIPAEPWPLEAKSLGLYRTREAARADVCQEPPAEILTEGTRT